MKDTIVSILKQWKNELSKEIPVDKLYLFGSSIINDGRMFKPKVSDIDLVITIPTDLTSTLQRHNWLVEVKKYKKKLEQELFTLLERADATTEIVSLVPITYLELEHDIHKSESREFFKTNEFLDVDSGVTIDGAVLFNFKEFENEYIIQILKSVQNIRNQFLKCSMNKDHDELKYEGQDLLPKKLMREAAKLASLENGEMIKGDSLNVSLGHDYMKNMLRDSRGASKEFLNLYTWLDDRNGGRSNSEDKKILSGENHQILYEMLFGAVLQKIQQDKDTKMSEELLSKLEVNSEFQSFLQDTGLLTKAHSQKEKLLLDDIYVDPEVERYDYLREYEKRCKFSEILEDCQTPKKILIAGEGQSGKTTLCKKLFIKFRECGFVPVYITDRERTYLGKFENKIVKAYVEQYNENVSFDSISADKIVPIIDDFHFAKNKEKIVQSITQYPNQVIIVDDIFELNFGNENLIKEFNHYKIKELIPSIRGKLIKNWVTATDNADVVNSNGFYRSIDDATEVVNTTLGKLMGGGIMPAYPFFILSVMSTYETFNKPLDQEITSQGYCYQVLIYMYLRKQGVKGDEIDTYINFLTELAYYCYSNNKTELDSQEFEKFAAYYKQTYNLPVEFKVILEKLDNTNIFTKDSFNNYSFYYLYIYYFFVGKYLAENLSKNREDIDTILSNLHKNDNAYIAIFISHHSREDYLLDEITTKASQLFSGFESSSLSLDELSFFDNKVDLVVKATLPHADTSPEGEREKDLKKQDDIENDDEKKQSGSRTEDEETDALSLEIRRSIKTVEVMGRIIKNRSGSLKIDKLETVFSAGMHVYLRVLKSFIELIKDDINEKSFIEFFGSKLTEIFEEKEKERQKELTQEIKEKIAKTLFWNLNFGVIYNFVNRIIHSLGSDQLTMIVKSVCDKENSPASFLVQHGILMWYNKNLQAENISQRLETDGFSLTAKHMMNYMIANHCRIHAIGFKEKQMIQLKFGIPSNALMQRSSGDV